jgi:putative PIG3 family NAD(P)H quinone oxidoreductase
MRAVVIVEPGGPEVLALRELPQPRADPDELLVRVRATGLNRADLLQRRGRYPAPAGAPPDVPGLECAGEVAETGAKVRDWNPGDRVMAIVAGGAYAEYARVLAAHALPIPERWSFDQAAAVPEAFVTAFDAMMLQGDLRAGHRVLVHAVGSSVGVAALQLAKAVGAVVAGTSRTAAKLERASALGLDRQVLVRDRFEPDASLTDWADLIIELVGGHYLVGDLRAVAPRGRIMLIGLTAGREATLDLGALLTKRVWLVGTVLRTRSREEKTRLLAAFRERVLPLFASGQVHPVVDRAFPAADVVEAHRYLEANRNFGSVVLSWR